MDPELSADERCALLRLARGAISERLLDDGSLETLLGSTEISPALKASRGAFVSLKEPSKETASGHRLRGCIGNITSPLALYRNVIDLAPKAALEDSRFTPLIGEELPRIRIEVSVLTPPRPLDSIDDIVLGRDGVQIDKAARRAVFLPQVASEQGWNTDQLLRQLSLKAGLKQDDWREATLSVFQADVFRERGLSGEADGRSGSTGTVGPYSPT